MGFSTFLFEIPPVLKNFNIQKIDFPESHASFPSNLKRIRLFGSSLGRVGK